MAEATECTDILAAIARIARASVEQATTLPPAAYADPALLRMERETIFALDWVCVGRVDECAAPGDFITTEVNGVPILIVRQRDGSIAAFENVCAHRASVIVDGKGCARAFTCPYHAWSYDIDGRLLQAPRMGRSFDTAGVGLRALALAEWQGFLFVSLAEKPGDLAPAVTGLSDAVAGYDMGAMRTLHRETLRWRCNWKVLVENALEAYHINATHRTTLAPVAPTSKVRVVDGPDDYFHYIAGLADGYAPPAPPPDIAIAQPALSDVDRRQAVVGGIFPSFVFSVASDWVWWIAMQPIGPGEVRIDHGLAGPFALDPASADPSLPSLYFLDLANAFNAEDQRRTEAVQRGAESGRGRQSPLSPLEVGTHRFARYLTRAFDRASA